MSDHPRLSDLDTAQTFADRHIGPGHEERATMLAALGFESLDELMEAAVPGRHPLHRRPRPARARDGVAGGPRAA